MAGGEEWLEQFVSDTSRDAGAVVAHMVSTAYATSRVVTFSVGANLPHRYAPASGRVTAVAEDVQQHLERCPAVEPIGAIPRRNPVPA
jgi:hypothetical protein